MNVRNNTYGSTIFYKNKLLIIEFNYTISTVFTIKMLYLVLIWQE